MLKLFRDDESGAVTVDWVVLTAAIVGLGFAVLNSVGPQTVAYSDEIVTELDSQGIATY
ncbi:hypothetical protein [Cochlodiniinecator piscidefendens]|uniref:hypothetical protein n=1 Tax=Cochlodiniinecator piscidefendens TaxID=2715756 RepID=UPI00140C1FEC|nr:hypothetical protein [Cochlodiniinecator piscidefendens]